MGKRELLLIAGFVLAGVVVYYATAPAGDPAQSGLSAIGKILDEVRREIRGHHSSAEVSSSTVTPLRPDISELRIETGTPLTVVGEDRTDVVFDLNVWSNGADEAEAKRYAGETRLKIAEAGSALIVGMHFPEPAQQRASLAVRVPRTLAIRVQPTRSKLDISDVASAELVDCRGPVTLRRVSGRATILHRGGGLLTLEEIARLKLSTRGSSVVLKGVAADAILQLQGGELRGAGLAGPIEIESNDTRVTFEDMRSVRKPVRANAVGGTLRLEGVAHELRIDARNTRVDLVVAKPAPIAVYTEGSEPLSVSLPPGGYDLDALAMGSRLTLPGGLLDVTSSNGEERASGPIGGGGPTITLRSSRGDLSIKMEKPQNH